MSSKESLPEINQKAIHSLQIASEVTNTKIDNLSTSLNRIETNHLVHLKEDITNLSTKMDNFMTGVTTQISNLKISDAKREPSNKLLDKAIEIIITAVISGGVALLIVKNI